MAGGTADNFVKPQQLRGCFVRSEVPSLGVGWLCCLTRSGWEAGACRGAERQQSGCGMQDAGRWGGSAASSPREQEQCCWMSWAVMGSLVIPPWEDLEMLFGSVLGLSRLGLVSAEHWLDQAPWCGASLGAAAWCFRFGGLQRGSECAASGLLQPLRVCSCCSSPQFLWWVEGQEEGGGFGGCSAMLLYGRAAPEPGQHPGSGAFPKLAGRV